MRHEKTFNPPSGSEKNRRPSLVLKKGPTPKFDLTPTSIKRLIPNGNVKVGALWPKYNKDPKPHTFGVRFMQKVNVSNISPYFVYKTNVLALPASHNVLNWLAWG